LETARQPASEVKAANKAPQLKSFHEKAGECQAISFIFFFSFFFFFLLHFFFFQIVPDFSRRALFE
jgi:hypothetical protein